MGPVATYLSDSNMKIVLVVSIFLVLTVMVTCQESGISGFRNDLLAATNDFRRGQGKDDLSQSTRLDRMAQEWADNLAGRDDCHIEHSPQRPGYAENISGASPTMSAQGAVQGWKNSPGHRRNMLRDLSKMGAGLAEMKPQCKLRWIAVAVYH